MQGDDTACKEAVPDRAEAGLREQVGERVSSGEAANARGEGRVRGAAGQRLAEERHDAVEPHLVERRQRAARRRDLEDAEPARRLQNAPQLAEPGLEVVDVTHAEADG